MSTWESNYLAHFGILGQRWGVRRFQNEDGTLTEEGKRRYNLMESAKKELSDAIADNLESSEQMKRAYKDAKAYYKQHPETSKTEQEKYLREQFGNAYWDDESIKNFVKDIFGVDDPYKLAREEMAFERKQDLESYKRQIDAYAAEAQIFIKRYEHLTSMKIEDLSKHDVDQLKRFINRNMKNEPFFLDD